MSDQAVTSKMVFLRKLQRDEQLGMLYYMNMVGSNEDAKLKAEIITLKDEIKYIKGELAGIAHRRLNDPTVDTSQNIQSKIQEAESRRFDWLAWFRDRVLPNVVTLIILAVLYMTFGGKVP